MASSMFPDPRRIVTGHSPEGKAIILADGAVPCLPTQVKSNFAVLYETHRFPESNDEWVDPIKSPTTNLANDQGIVLRVVDFAPNTETVSSKSLRARERASDNIFPDAPPNGISGFWDLAQWRNHLVCHVLHLMLDTPLIHFLYPSHLDDGVRVDLKAGDVCVQRGTIHAWVNYSDKPARVYFILTGMACPQDLSYNIPKP